MANLTSEERKSQKNKIQNIVTTLLTTGDITKLPINLSKIQKEIESILQIELIITEKTLSTNLSGIVVNQGHQVGILINAMHHPHRKRFTLAHELGHLVLNHKLNLKYYETQENLAGKSIYEIEANKFASELLLPTKLLRNYLRTNKFENTKELATKLEVSEEALWWKIKEEKMEKEIGESINKH